MVKGRRVGRKTEEISSYAFEASNITYFYKQVMALHNFNLKVEKGSVYALLGLNGAGKSTLVHLLTGQRRLQEGTVRIAGYELCPASAGKINGLTGYVPENKSMYTYMTPKQMLELTMSFYRQKVKTLKGMDYGKAAKSCLELFELPMNRKISDLSKGMISQLALILALYGEPELLILDEPADGLDPVKRNQLFNILLELVGEAEKTVFMTTNVISDVEKIADHAGILKEGKLLLDGETDAIIENRKKIRVVFDDDFTPDFQNWPGVWRVERENRSYLLHIGADAGKLIEKIRQLPYVFLDVMNMNLEDIFVEMTEG